MAYRVFCNDMCEVRILSSNAVFVGVLSGNLIAERELNNETDKAVLVEGLIKSGYRELK